MVAVPARVRRTRRPGALAVLGAMAVGAMTVAACGTDDATGGSGTDASSGPDDDLVVLALDDFAALHALTLGIEPDLVLEAFEYESTSAIFDSLDLATQAYGSELDLEAVAAADPDVIIGVSIPTTAAVEEQLDEIAPTTVIDYSSGWSDQLDAVAVALDRTEEAEAVRARLAAQSTEVAQAVADAGSTGAVVSVVGDNGGFFSPPAATAIGQVLTDVGWTRPAAQQAATDATSPFVSFVAETLSEHDGDVLFLLSGGAYLTDGLTGSPLWSTLGAVSGSAVQEVSGEMWLASSAFSVAWVLDDIAAVVGGGEPATAGDAPARFTAFTGA